MALHVTFIGVYRLLDQICVASYSPKGGTNDEIAVKSVISSPNVLVEPGRRYSNEGAVCCVHFVADGVNRVFAVVTDKAYPARVAFTLVEEVQSKFVTKVGDKSLTAKEGSLSRAMNSTFADICIKYEDVKNVDKLSSLQGKVDAVKSKMEDNIAQILSNEEKLDSISANAENLNAQAKVFENRSNQLRKQMQWKSIKMWILLAFVISIVLIIIIVPLAVWCKTNC
jgi:hypothetical protein